MRTRSGKRLRRLYHVYFGVQHLAERDGTLFGFSRFTLYRGVDLMTLETLFELPDARFSGSGPAHGAGYGPKTPIMNLLDHDGHWYLTSRGTSDIMLPGSSYAEEFREFSAFFNGGVFVATSIDEANFVRFGTGLPTTDNGAPSLIWQFDNRIILNATLLDSGLYIGLQHGGLWRYAN